MDRTPTGTVPGAVGELGFMLLLSYMNFPLIGVVTAEFAIQAPKAI